MEIQYICDGNGERIGVVVPIDIWHKIKPEIEGKWKPFNPLKYRGIYQNLEVNLEREIKKLREEWLRI